MMFDEVEMEPAARKELDNQRSDKRKEIIDEPKRDPLPTTVALKNRIPYSNGYGDFCFAPLDDGPRVSMTEVLVETSGFQRSGSFEFFKLPALIRSEIFRLLLAPFFSYDKDSKTGYIYLRIGLLVTWSHRNLLSHQVLDDAFGRWLSASCVDDPDSLSREQTYKALLSDEQQNKTLHPDRKAVYGFEEFDPYYNDVYPKLFPDHAFASYLEWIRQASNVSTVFQQELGGVFWARTRIEANTDDHCFRGLLLDRPSIAHCLKSLTIYVAGLAQNGKSNFPTWLAQIACLPELRLDHLKYYVSVEKDVSEMYPYDVYDLKVQELARSMKVSKSVEVIIYGFGVEKEEFSKLLTELMMPDTLRVESTKTEMEKYLEARKEI